MASVLYLTGQSEARVYNHTLITHCESTEGDTILGTLAHYLIID